MRRSISSVTVITVTLVVHAWLGPAVANAATAESPTDGPTMSWGAVLHLKATAERDELVRAAVELKPELELDFGHGWRAVLSGRLRGDLESRIAPADDHAELRDAYLEWRRTGTRLRLGKQRQVWGVVDGFAILDQLQPRSFREFVLDDTDSSRIGQWMLWGRTELGRGRLELAWVPRPDAHELPAQGSLYDFVAPRFRYGAPLGRPAPPRRSVDHDGDLLAARYEVRAGRFDLSAVALTGPEAQPLGRLAGTPEAPGIELYRRSRTLLGGTLSTAVGSAVARAELGWTFDAPFNVRRPGLEEVQRDRLQAALAVDVELPAGLFTSWQLVVDQVRDAPPGLVRPAEDVLGSVLVRRSWLADTVLGELRILGSAEGDRLWRLAMTYRGDDRWSLKLEVDVFTGELDGIFGQYRERDRLSLGFETYF